MKHAILTLFGAIAVAGALAGAGAAFATPEQPAQDEIDIDVECGAVTVDWIDGRQDVTGYTVARNGIVIVDKDLDDIVGDQGGQLERLAGAVGDQFIARLFVGDEDVDFDTGTIVAACPTPSPTATATSTATATATATAVPPTATPVPPTATPIVIVEQVLVPVFVPQPIVQAPAVAPTARPATTSVIRPPSTGDGGLAD